MNVRRELALASMRNAVKAHREAGKSDSEIRAELIAELKDNIQEFQSINPKSAVHEESFETDWTNALDDALAEKPEPEPEIPTDLATLEAMDLPEVPAVMKGALFAMTMASAIRQRSEGWSNEAIRQHCITRAIYASRGAASEGVDWDKCLAAHRECLRVIERFLAETST